MPRNKADRLKVDSRLNNAMRATVEHYQPIDMAKADNIVYSILTGDLKVKKPIFNPLTKNFDWKECEPDHSERLAAYDKLCKRFGWFAPKSVHITGDSSNTLKISFVDPPPKPVQLVSETVNVIVRAPIPLDQTTTDIDSTVIE